ncbi:trypsin-like serine protease [Nonomuraea spiralis]|uniref:Trypsin-like serine protease n=1 Tax=Nonomuraea spiralis TaxID=46182 RepID=A0ABV5IVW4_9ACTN|nr:hypothetical protein GCM10010176_029630 [Nonomuraea spiralis]
MDRRRLALIRGGDATRFLRVGTGYLIGRRLVLTARHVVEASKGTPWAQIVVRVGHPHDADVHRCLASVRWTDPEERDVALLLLDNEVDVPGTIRWGRPVGNTPLPYQGLAYPSATFKDGQHKVEHLRGKLPPQAGGVGAQDLYVLDQESAPDMRADGEQAWSGASGSAVFCQDHLVGVVIHDDHAFANRRLHACPARTFTGNPAFATLLQRYGDGPPEPVDITSTPPHETPATTTPNSAHKAEAEGPGPEIDSLPAAEPAAAMQGRTETNGPFDMSWTGKEPLSTYATMLGKRGWKGLATLTAIGALASVIGFSLMPGLRLEKLPGEEMPPGFVPLMVGVLGALFAVSTSISTIGRAYSEHLLKNRAGWGLYVGPHYMATTSVTGRREFAWDQIQRVTIEAIRPQGGNVEELRGTARYLYTGIHIRTKYGPGVDMYPAGWPYPWPGSVAGRGNQFPICVLGPMLAQQRAELTQALARYGGQKWKPPKA